MKYVVMCLRRSIELNGVETDIRPYNGCIGYMPVFNTRKAAEKFADKKYDLLQIRVKKETP